MSATDIRIRVGKIARNCQPFVLEMGKLMNQHFAVLGVSGGGKSRLTTDVILQWLEQGGGATVLEPGDLTEDVLAHVAERLSDPTWRRMLNRIHYFEPGNYAVTFALDPFRFEPAKPIHPELWQNAYVAWLATTIDHIAELVQLKQGQVDFEQNARLQRVLRNVLKAVGTAIDKKGRHPPLSAALVLLDVDDPHHQELFELVSRNLDRDTLADFNRLKRYRRDEDRLKEIESTINRLRALLNPILRAMFGVPHDSPVVNTRQIILDRHLQLWNVRPTEYFGHDAKRTFGQLVIHNVLQTMMSMPRDIRVPHLLVIDEVGEFINDELLWGLGALRKTGLSVWLCAQDLSSLRKRDGVDLVPKVLSQCNVITFQQAYPDDADILARRVYSGDLDFTALVHEVDRHDGYGWHRVTELSFSASRNSNWTKSNAVAESDTTGEQSGESTQETTSWQKTSGSATARGSSHTDGSGETENESRSWSESPILRGGRLVDKIRLGSVGKGSVRSRSQSDSTSETETDSQTSGEGGSRGVTQTRTMSTAHASGTTDTRGEGGGEQQGVTVSQKLVPLAQIRRETQKTGMLEQSVSDQLEQKRAHLMTLRQRFVVVKLHDRPCAIEVFTREVRDPFASPLAQMHAVEWVKRELYQIHPYYFVPSFDPAEDERRLREFLAGADSTAAEATGIDSQSHESPETSPIL